MPALPVAVHHVVVDQREVVNQLEGHRPDQGILTVRTEGVNQDDRKICSFTRAVLLPRSPARIV